MGPAESLLWPTTLEFGIRQGEEDTVQSLKRKFEDVGKKNNGLKEKVARPGYLMN